MRNYEYHKFSEKWNGRTRFGYEQRLLSETNPKLIANFNKVAKWIKDNCPHLNGKFRTPHNFRHWVQLSVENGKAYLEYGSHGWGFDVALSADETAVMSQGSMQRIPYAFKGVQFAHNDRLEEFLANWKAIKDEIIKANEIQMNVFSDEFVA